MDVFIIYAVFLGVSFLASIVGAICGIGGGVIIKPVLDAFGVLDVSAISFLSGCTVLAMSLYSVGRGKISGTSMVEKGFSPTQIQWERFKRPVCLY